MFLKTKFVDNVDCLDSTSYLYKYVLEAMLASSKVVLYKECVYIDQNKWQVDVVFVDLNPD